MRRRLAAQNEAIHARVCIYGHGYSVIYICCNTYAGVGVQATLRMMRVCVLLHIGSQDERIRNADIFDIFCRNRNVLPFMISFNITID